MMPRQDPPRLEDLPEILTPMQIAEYLRLSRNTVYALLRKGAIRAIGGNGPDRFCRSWRVSKQALRDYIEGDRRTILQDETKAR